MAIIVDIITVHCSRSSVHLSFGELPEFLTKRNGSEWAIFTTDPYYVDLLNGDTGLTWCRHITLHQWAQALHFLDTFPFAFCSYMYQSCTVKITLLFEVKWTLDIGQWGLYNQWMSNRQGLRGVHLYYFSKKETCAQGNVMKQRGKYHFIFPIGKF